MINVYLKSIFSGEILKRTLVYSSGIPLTKILDPLLSQLFAYMAYYTSGNRQAQPSTRLAGRGEHRYYTIDHCVDGFYFRK